MNIFILSNDPIEAARLQCDKHVVKMILESGQMLCTAHRMADGIECRKRSKSGKRIIKYYELLDDREDLFYKAVHHYHPCTVWTMESKANYDWHYRHFVALCQEYSYRYNKVHLTQTKLEHALRVAPKNIPDIEQTPFKLAMGAAPECIFPDDPIKSYKLYYKTKQERFKMSWSKRQIPDWFTAVAS